MTDNETGRVPQDRPPLSDSRRAALEARLEAERELSAARSNSRAVTRLADSLRALRTENHFGERIGLAMREGK